MSKMNQPQVETAAAQLMAALLAKKYLPIEDKLVHSYIESQEVRTCVRRFADCFGVRVVRKEKNIHMLVQPKISIFTNPLDELKRSTKTYRSRTDLYLLGLVFMVIFAEADNDIPSKIKWENDGISYGEIEELVTEALNYWHQLNLKSDGTFSEEWSLAVNDMYNKWRLLPYNKSEKGRVTYVKDTKFGVIESAARELEKDKMIFIERTTLTSKLTPTPVFFERLKARFGNMDNYQDRYDILKALVEDAKETGEVGA